MTGLLFAAIDVPEEVVGEFHRWYDTEHVPERAAVPGFGPITRWERLDGDLPRFLALFETESPGTLTSGPYAALKAAGDTPWTAALRPSFVRTARASFAAVADYGGCPGATAVCCAALTDVDPEDEADYRRWYDDEHGPAVAAVPGVVRVRRFEAPEGATRHLTLLDLASAGVLAGEDYAAAKRSSPADGLRARWRRSQGVYAVLGPYRDATYQREG
jgi:hypothetical protein